MGCDTWSRSLVSFKSRLATWRHDAPLCAVVDGLAGRIAQIFEIGFLCRLQAGSEQGAGDSGSRAQAYTDQRGDRRLKRATTRQAAEESIKDHHGEARSHRHHSAKLGASPPPDRQYEDREECRAGEREGRDRGAEE